MKKLILSVALATALLCTLAASATAGFLTVHQEEIEQQRP